VFVVVVFKNYKQRGGAKRKRKEKERRTRERKVKEREYW
jgi:hypothetical protein